MMHRTRRWIVSPVASIEELARMLTQITWTLCSGFYVEGHPEYLFLNDSTYEDAAHEFAVVKGRVGAPEHVQIESITFSWCTLDEAIAFVKQALAGEMDAGSFARPVRPRLDAVAEHGTCHLCA